MVSSLRLEVLLEDVVGGTLLAPVSDDTRGAFDHLSSGALPVDLAQTSPLSELHVAVNLDERNAVLHAQGGDQLLVHGLVAVLGQDAQQRLTLVKRLGSLTDTAGETVGDESLLQDLLDGGVDVHGAGGGGCSSTADLAPFYPYFVTLKELLETFLSLLKTNFTCLV